MYKGYSMTKGHIYVMTSFGWTAPGGNQTETNKTYKSCCPRYETSSIKKILTFGFNYY